MSAGDRPVAPPFDSAELRAALGGPLPEEGTEPSRGDRAARRGGRARAHDDGGPALLRLRGRRRAGQRHLRGRSHHRMGPDGLHRDELAGGGGRRGDRGRVAEAGARPARRRHLRHRHGGAGREQRRARRGTPPGPGPRRLGRGGAGAHRRAEDPGGGKRGAPRHRRPRAATARDRGGRSRAGGRRRQRRDRPRRARPRARGRGEFADDRLPPVRQREHRRVRRRGRRVRCRRRQRRLGPRGRRFRALGGRQRVEEAPGQRPGAGGFLGRRRPQVAERPVRHWLRLLRGRRGPRRLDVVHGRLPRRSRHAGRSGRHPTTSPSRPAALAASPPGRRSASWGRRGWPTSSIAAARWRAASATSLARSTASR